MIPILKGKDFSEFLINFHFANIAMERNKNSKNKCLHINIINLYPYCANFELVLENLTKTAIASNF